MKDVGCLKRTTASILLRSMWQAVPLQQQLGSKKSKNAVEENGRTNPHSKHSNKATRHSKDCVLVPDIDLHCYLDCSFESLNLKHSTEAYTYVLGRWSFPDHATLDRVHCYHLSYPIKNQRWTATRSHWFLGAQLPPGLLSWWEHSFIHYYYAEAQPSWFYRNIPVGYGWAKLTTLTGSRLICSEGFWIRSQRSQELICFPEILPLFQEKGYNILIAKLTEQVSGVCWEYSFICIGFFIVVVVWCCFRGYVEQLKSHWVYTKYPRDRSILTWGYRWQRLEPVWWKNKIFLLLQGKTKTNASVLPTATPHVTTPRQALTRQAGSVKRNLQNRVLIETNTFYKHQLHLN